MTNGACGSFTQEAFSCDLHKDGTPLITEKNAARVRMTGMGLGEGCRRKGRDDSVKGKIRDEWRRNRTIIGSSTRRVVSADRQSADTVVRQHSLSPSASLPCGLGRIRAALLLPRVHSSLRGTTLRSRCSPTYPTLPTGCSSLEHLLFIIHSHIRLPSLEHAWHRPLKSRNASRHLVLP